MTWRTRSSASCGSPREFRICKDPNELRLAIVREMTGLLQLEDRIDRAARQKIRSQKRDIAEGGRRVRFASQTLLCRRIEKFGITLNH